MDTNENKPNDHRRIAARRGFLAGVAFAPALAAAAALLTKKADSAIALPAMPDEPPDQKGYHETEHIRKYYSTAAF